MKSANVSYSVNERCKTLSVPLIRDGFTFGTGMTDPVWSRAVSASDFVLYHQEGFPGKESRMAVFRDERHLLIGFFFTEEESDRTHLAPGDSSIWHGDLSELHFGGLEPDPWLLQLAVGIDGVRFDSAGTLDRWEAKVFSAPEGWGAEIRMDLAMLRLSEGGFRFNMVRESLKRKERIVWSHVVFQYHEVPNFGELLFAPYEDIASFRTGKTFSGPMSRDDFERVRAQWEIPANQVIHGPFVSCPDRDSLCVSWQTAGKVAAGLSYRVKGSGEPFLRAGNDFPGGILPCETVHFVRLHGLRPDTEYEYELFSLFPVSGSIVKNDGLHTFRTLPDKGTAFSFFVFTDLHSEVAFLRKALALPEAKNASLQISLGDHLSYATGPDGIYDGVIDPLVQANQRNGRDIPLVFVRGNHEELGIYAADFFRIMRHPSGRSWFTFSLGGVFFTVLDSGDDSADSPARPFFDNTEMFEQERLFLKETVVSREYRDAAFRIVLMHIPPTAGEPPLRNWPLQRKIAEPLAQAEILPDLMLCGHEHKYFLLEAGNPAGLSFPILVCANRDVLSCEVGSEQMKLQVLTPLDGGKSKIRRTIVLDSGRKKERNGICRKRI